MNYTAVITTINEPTKAVKEVAARLPLIVIGDEKTPKGWCYDDVQYYNNSIRGLSYQPPVNHYSRKNIGYLIAMGQGADCIYDTDDDNIPNSNWALREKECKAMLITNKGWVNVYAGMLSDKIWPRGLPLNQIHSIPNLGNPETISSPIHQGLADKSPDVDAVWRLINGEDIYFKYDRSIYLPKGTWSPFNSQSTWWFKEAFPLMYLPQYCSMRMTDIIRSFVAQRCLSEMGYGVVFHSPAEVIQERNEHDLLKDFEDEVQGYLMNDKIRVALDEIELLGAGLRTNILTCYEKLISMRVLPRDEYIQLIKWLNDINEICRL